MTVVRHHLFFRIARVDGGLEYLHTLFGKLSALQAAYQLLRLSGEHGAADNFDSAPAMGFLYVVFRE